MNESNHISFEINYSTLSPSKSKSIRQIPVENSIDDNQNHRSSRKANTLIKNADDTIFPQEKSDNIDEVDLKINSLLEILKKKPTSRTVKEFKILSKFLQNSELMQKFNKTFQNTDTIYEMVNICSTCIEYQFLKEDEYLFKEGDPGDKFYIIIKGSVKVIKSKQIEITMTIHDYLNFLNNLHEKGEKQILMKILKINKEVFNFDHNIIDHRKEIINKLNLKNKISNIFDLDELKLIFEELNPILYKTLYAGEDININHMALIKSNINKEISDFLATFNIHPNENIDSEKRVKTLEPFLFAIFEKGSYFGDYALERLGSERTASIIGNEETHLGFIEIKDYKSYILKNKISMEIKESEYLLHTFLNKFTDKSNFYNEYFKYFLFKEKKKGEILLDECDNIENIYFIKEGELEYSFNGSLVKLSKELKLLAKKFNFGYNLMKTEENLLTNNLKDKSINTSKKMKIFTLESDSSVGLSDFLLKNENIFKIKVISNTLKYYVIDAENFSKLIEKEERLFKYLHSTAINKIKANYERLSRVKDQNYEMISRKNNEFQEKIKITEPAKSTLNLPVIPISLNSSNNKELRNKILMQSQMGQQTKNYLNYDTLTNSQSSKNIPRTSLVKNPISNITLKAQTPRGVIFSVNQNKIQNTDSPIEVKKKTNHFIPNTKNQIKFNFDVKTTESSIDHKRGVSQSTNKLVNLNFENDSFSKGKTIKIGKMNMVTTNSLSEVIGLSPEKKHQNKYRNSSCHKIIIRKSSKSEYNENTSTLFVNLKDSSLNHN